MTDEPNPELGALTAAFVQLVTLLETKGVLARDEFAAILESGAERLSVDETAAEMRKLAGAIRPPGPHLVD